MATRTMVSEISQRLGITVHSKENPTDDEWNALLLRIRRFDNLSEHRVIVYSAGGGPDVNQRRQMSAVFEGHRPPRTALLTDAVAARGIATALSWFRSDLRVFRTDQREEACGYLGLSAAETERVNSTIDRLLRELANRS
jgi:hypothetical protein